MLDEAKPKPTSEVPVIETIIAVYIGGVGMLLFSTLCGFCLLATESIKDAVAFVRFILPAIFMWPYLLFIVAPRMLWAKLRRI